MACAWDGPAGRTRVYLNGLALGLGRGSPVFSRFPAQPDSLHVGGPGIAVDDLRVYDEALDEAQLGSLVALTPPSRFAGEGMLPGDAALDLSHVKKEPVYEDTFDSDAALKDWVLEGPGRVWVQDGRMMMTSHLPDRGKHMVNWCRHDFPADFVCEWDFRRTVQTGLTIAFFCARGTAGQDIFDPSLAPRDGTFRHYILGDVNSYHISYYACGRESTNMRKNSAFYLTAVGKDRVTPEPVDKWHRITILKHGNKVRLAVNGVLCLAFDDDGKTYKPVWGEGKIGLRQMAHTHTGMYDNFRVYRIVE